MSQHLQFIRIRGLFHTGIIVIAVCYCNTAVTCGDKTPFCRRVKLEHGVFEVSFLTNQLDSSLRFYWSRWTSERSVDDCFTNTDATLIARYSSLCGERAQGAAEKLPQFNLSLILEDDSLCKFNTNPLSSVGSQNEDVKKIQQMDSSVKSRQKRALLLLPGTLWCGRGSSANSYEQLGMFENADRCCRQHDHCEHIIRAFSVNFGVFNPTLFTISHCDCDHRFKQCLLAGNDTISNMVGYSFFNALKIRCFELYQRKRCTQFNWFGMCTSFQEAPVAVLKDSTPYNSTIPNNESRDITDPSCKEELLKSSHKNNQRSSTSKQMRLHKEQKNCVSVKHAKQDAFQLSQKSVKKSDKKKKIQAAKPRKTVWSNSPFTPSPQTHTSTIKQRTSLKNKQKRKDIERKAIVTPSSVSVTKSLLIRKTSTTAPSKQTVVTKSSLQRKKNKTKSHSRSAVTSRKSKKCTTKHSPFHTSRQDHYQQKHHRGKNTSKR
ncbi:group 3 secretory phospholipase A2 [Triplophysa rosa]|uniref:Group 3 secretory phospholipase A2-like n=1 Tax=Triplophysa rosa TaxID=992332 RepID=A0A9W8CCC1_TRIRA|nr:group 3 secretory phospholipase A2 [Triplophysa rosa]KAI7814273.1 putative group 3 secretory phospholipase A2-like [Triplophysa rosa]